MSKFVFTIGQPVIIEPHGVFARVMARAEYAAAPNCYCCEYLADTGVIQSLWRNEDELLPAPKIKEVTPTIDQQQ